MGLRIYDVVPDGELPFTSKSTCGRPVANWTCGLKVDHESVCAHVSLSGLVLDAALAQPAEPLTADEAKVLEDLRRAYDDLEAALDDCDYTLRKLQRDNKSGRIAGMLSSIRIRGTEAYDIFELPSEMFEGDDDDVAEFLQGFSDV